MNHLTETQFESIIQGEMNLPKHLQECTICANRFAEKQDIKKRLQRAFMPVQASDELAEQIKRRIRIRVQSSCGPNGNSSGLSTHWRYWMAAAAAIIVVPLLALLFAPSSAMAANAELAQIHSWNLDPDHMFFSESDPAKLASYFKKNLGFHPLMPESHNGLALRGCCVQHFRGRESGSYVVDTPNGIISIIAVLDSLSVLEMDDRFEKDGYLFGKSAFANNSMVGVRIGNYTYCAVGEVSHDYLTSVLVELLADAES